MNHKALPYSEANTKASGLLAQLSLEEKIELIGGTRGFFIKSVERLGMSEVFMADASCGVKIRESWLEDRVDTDLEKSTAFPSSIMLASTWNPELAGEYARSIGEECRAAGIGILLGPGMNIYRHSQAGRNFEYLGEDPFLASEIIKSYVGGLQSTGVAATLKHFIANNSDYFRRKSNSVVSDRALREIYLPAFKAGVQAGARAVMTAYNLYNGEWCSQNKDLITGVLREEVGFQWLVMTDWWAIWDAEKAVKSGQDLEMPARDILNKVEELLEQGNISEAHIDRMVLSIISTCISMDFYQENFARKEFLEQFEAHEEVSLQCSRQGAVLLKNAGDLLPLKDSPVLLTGLYADKLARGGGAAQVDGYNYLTLREAMEEYYPGEVRYVENPSDEDIRKAGAVVLSTGTFDSEGWDRPFALPAEEEARILRILELNPHTVVVVNSGGGIRMTGWADKAAAILHGWYGGQTGSRALAEILAGTINPSGKLPITIEKEFADSPGADYLPAGEKLYYDWNDEEEKKHPVFDVSYDEGILIGYRWYESKGIEPLFPFGHGLSYSRFSLGKLTLDRETLQAGSSLNFSVELENTGSVKGMETLQIYVKDCTAPVLRPEKELKAFRKVSLKPGEKKSLAFCLEADAFSYWDEKKKDWTIAPGDFRILAGFSSADIREEISITVV